MTAVALTLALVVAPEPDAAALVSELAKAAPSERAALVARIEALGSKALPALRAARKSKDAQFRQRAAAVLEKIETGMLVRPTWVSIDLQDQTILDAVASVSSQAGVALALEPRTDPTWRSGRVTLRDAQPLPFWEALDRVGKAGRFHLNPAFALGARERAAVLHLEEGVAESPTSFSGPFRVNLLSAHRRHDLSFQPTEAQDDAEDMEEPDPERFEVFAQVFAEPRLLITLNGPPKELKARDDFDQDLVPPPPEPDPDGDDPAAPAAASGIERGPAPVPGLLSVVQFPIALRAPERPGTTIDRLEGVIPLQVASRRPEPLIVALDGSGGRAFETEELAVRLPDGKLELTARGTLELFVTLKQRPDALAPDPVPAAADFPEPRPVDTLQNRLEVVDAEDRALQYVIKDVQTDDTGESRVLLTLAARERNAAAVRLRFYSLVVGAIEVPFKFAKVPMP